MPAVSLPIFSLLTASARRTPSLNAAATRSSSMSLSSASRLGSISTRLTSCLQVMVTFTSPAPDSPCTSMVASSSCAFFRLSCIAWACFMRPASCPLLNMECFLGCAGDGLPSHGFDAARHDFRAKVPLHLLHEGVVLDHLLGGPLPLGCGSGVAARRAVDDGADLDAQLDRVAGGLQRRLQPVARGGLVERL